MGMFHTTHWSLVLRAGESTPQAREALAQLCRAYRAPVLAYVRHTGLPNPQAEDLTQEFFLKLLEHRYHARADPRRGRFRTFLLTALQRHLAKARGHDHALKRGGRTKQESLQDARASDIVVDARSSPEHAFEQAWARTVIQRALARLEIESIRAGKSVLFAQLQPFLVEQPDANDYAALAAALGLKRNTVAAAVHRMRVRLRELIRRELADTVSAGPELEAELHALREALGGRGRHPTQTAESSRHALM